MERALGEQVNGVSGRARAIWLNEEAIENWTPKKTGKRGRLQLYSDIAIQVSLLIRLVFKQPLRQTTGFLRSIKKAMGLDIPIPRHSTLSDRSEGLEVIRIAEKIEPGSRSGRLGETAFRLKKIT